MSQCLGSLANGLNIIALDDINQGCRGTLKFATLFSTQQITVGLECTRQTMKQRFRFNSRLSQLPCLHIFCRILLT